MSNSSFSTVKLAAASSMAATVTNIGDGVTVWANDDDLTNVSLDYTGSGLTATNTSTIKVGGAAATNIGTLTVTDAQTVTITANATGAADDTAIGVTGFDNTDTDYISISTSKAGAGVTQTGAFTASAAKTLTVTTGATNAHVTLGAGDHVLTNAAGLTAITLTAAGDDDSDIILTGTTGGTTAAAALTTITANASDAADITVSAITATGAALTSITANASTSGSVITFSDIVASSANSITATAVSGATVDFGSDIDIATVGTITLSGAGTFRMDDGSNGITSVENINASGVTGTVNIALLASTTTGPVVATLGSGADTFVGGDGADIITGGNGADSITGGAGADSIILTESVAAADEVVISSEATVDTITGFGSADQIDFDVSALNGAVLVDSTGTALAAGTAAGLISYTVGSTSAANATASNIIFVTNTTGIDGIADVNTALAADAITLDGGGTDVAATDGVLIVFYDEDDATAVIGFIEDADSATAGVLDGTNSTFVQLAGIPMTTTEYSALTAANFDFI